MSPRRRRARADRPILTTIWWRDIPVQVMARHDDAGEPVRAELPARFTHAIDRAAMQAGLAGTDDYLEQWDRRSRPCGPDLGAEVDAEVERLVAAHPRDVVADLVTNGGHSAAGHPDEVPPRTIPTTDQPARRGAP